MKTLLGILRLRGEYAYGKAIGIAIACNAGNCTGGNNCFCSNCGNC